MPVCVPCQHHRLALGEEGEGEGWEAEARVFPSGNWQSPYQRGRAKVRDWWGRSCRLIKKPSSAAVSPLLSCLTVFLCLYLVLPVIWPVKRRFAWRTEGRVEGWAVRRTGGQVGQFLYPAMSSGHHCGRAACILWIYLCLRLWVTPGKARRNLRDRRLLKSPPHLASHSLHLSIHPSSVCV